jgi:hypothetical protein
VLLQVWSGKHDVAMHRHVAVAGSQTGVEPMHMLLQGSGMKH